MSYLVLARKWRPQTFEAIRGQDHIVRALRNAISSGRIAHAYLFTGIRGVGKTSAARVLAKALNCVSGPTPTPCNACPSCREITEGRSGDVLEIDGASNTGVEDVRRLREAVRYPPVRGPHRVYIIDEVHMLSTAAFNALLKTLEEPPAHVVFVLATTDPHKIPVTILSRCQQFDFKRLSLREMTALLADVAHAEGIAADEKSLAALAREAEGSVRDGQSLLDQVFSYAGESVTYEDVRDVLGVVDRDLLFGVARAVVERDARRVVEALAEAERFGYDVRRFGHDLLDVFRDLTVIKALGEAEDLVDLAAEEVAAAREFLVPTSWEEIHALFDILSRGIDTLRGASRPGPLLEMTLLKMAKLPPVLPLSEVLARARAGPGAGEGGGGGAGGRPSASGHTGVEAAAGKTADPAPRDPGPGDRAAGASAEAAAAPSAAVAAVPAGEAPVPRGEAEVWEALLRGAEGANRPFWHVLRAHGRLEAWDPDGKVAAVVLDDPGHEFFVRSKLELLTRILAEAAGPGARVELRFEARQGRGRGRDGARETDRARSAKREALEHPLVREAMEIFEGDVEEVRVLKP
ncbi:MAG: DNA polymerase III subunit gamma/tau [Deferrisomatales bacterium]|nr:DNA polymerase III subunit gamma/tau [Deferrisomatales bacterium]